MSRSRPSAGPHRSCVSSSSSLLTPSIRRSGRLPTKHVVPKSGSISVTHSANPTGHIVAKADCRCGAPRDFCHRWKSQVRVLIRSTIFMDTSTLARELREEGLDTVSMRYERTRAWLPRDAHPAGDGPGRVHQKRFRAANRSVSLNRSRTIEIASGICGTSEITTGATSCQSLQFSWCFSLLRSRSAGSFSELKFAPIRHYSWRTPLCSKKCVDRFRVRRESDRNWVGWLQIALDELRDNRARAS